MGSGVSIDESGVIRQGGTLDNVCESRTAIHVSRGVFPQGEGSTKGIYADGNCIIELLEDNPAPAGRDDGGLAKGDAVQLTGLADADSLNGREGFIVSSFNHLKGRFDVELVALEGETGSDARVIAVRPKNLLRRMPGEAAVAALGADVIYDPVGGQQISETVFEKKSRTYKYW